MRVGGEGEGWSWFPKPSRTVTEMGGSRVRNLEEGKRERRKDRKVERRKEEREKGGRLRGERKGYKYHA